MNGAALSFQRRRRTRRAELESSGRRPKGTGSVRLRPTGRWQALAPVWIDGKRRQRGPCFNTEAEAEAWLAGDRDPVPQSLRRSVMADAIAMHDDGICDIRCQIARGRHGDECVCKCDGMFHGWIRNEALVEPRRRLRPPRERQRAASGVGL
jgi:hypothetical protein